MLQSGRVLTGVKVAETARALTIGDARGETHAIPRSEIDELHQQNQSTMPEGLEKHLTDREFQDLITFLAAQKTSR